jgi:PEP-CTERM motif
MKRFAMAAAAAFSLALPATGQAATQVNITASSWAVGSDNGVLHFATSPFNNQGVGIGEFKLTGNYVATNAAASFYTYCVDIFHTLSLPGIFDVTPLSQMYTGVRATNINKILANTNPATADQSAAVQLALWEVAFETGATLDVTSGAFYVDGGNSATARTLANSYLGNLGIWQVSSNQTAMLLYSQTRQSQVYLAPVPEASTWAMIIVGFGVAGAALRSRRRSTMAPALV